MCLFQWFRDRPPTSKEVLDIFNANRDITHSALDAKDFTRSELRSCLGLLLTRYGQRSRFEKDFFLAFLQWTGSRTVICDSGMEKTNPAPCFMLTALSDGWTGGILYGV